MMKEKQIITIAGGGSGYTPGIVLTMLEHEELQIEEIRLYDNDVKKNENMEVIINFILEKYNYDVNFLRTENPEKLSAEWTLSFHKSVSAAWKCVKKMRKFP